MTGIRTRWALPVMLAVGLGAAPVSAQAAGKTLGLVVTWFAPANFEDGHECPDGFTQGPDPGSVLAKMSEVERQRLSRPENHKDLFEALLHRGPHGEDVCAKPTSVPDPGLRTVEGKTAFGLDLDGTVDGAAANTTCAHEKFVSPTGEPGIDNQFYRVRGCMPTRRNTGFLPAYDNSMMRSGDFTLLIEVSGITDGRNDPDVQVGIYESSDPMATDASGKPLPDASLSVTDKPEWRARTHGKIIDGILTTDPVDMRFKADGAVPPFEYWFRAARLRLTLLPNGGAEGLLDGYQDLEMLSPTAPDPERARLMTGLESKLGGPATCPGYYYALHRMADGFKDPKTGKCTAISSAYDVQAIPAFIIHPTTHQAGSPRPPSRTASGD